MPGKFVFPGGAVDPDDRRMAVAAPLDEAVAEKLLAKTRRTSHAYARALALAAIRETFEETGLALGVTDLGPPPDPPAGVWARFAATGVFPTLEGLDFLARAITPPGRTRRFDARFFVADAAWIAHRAQGVVHEEAELTELVWAPIEEALRWRFPASRARFSAISPRWGRGRGTAPGRARSTAWCAASTSRRRSRPAACALARNRARRRRDLRHSRSPKHAPPHVLGRSRLRGARPRHRRRRARCECRGDPQRSRRPDWRRPQGRRRHRRLPRLQLPVLQEGGARARQDHRRRRPYKAYLQGLADPHQGQRRRRQDSRSPPNIRTNTRPPTPP